MLATALSATLVGLQAHLVRVEVEGRRGPYFFEIVGLPELSVRESRVRVKSALAQLGVHLGECQIVINLAPADVRKTGSGFDLAIAAAALGAMGAVPPESCDDTLLIGELSLEGTVQPLRGVLPQLLGARERGVTRAIVPRANAAEAALVDGIEVRTVGSLAELLEALSGRDELPLARPAPETPVGRALDDLADVRGQAGARRALEIAAAGGHNLLMIGPPGAGKTMLARRLPGLLPPLSTEEALEVTAIHSVAGLLSASRGLSRARPFRAPHHTVSEMGLVGGGEGPRPGEVSLAHQGVLFLDELAEFRRGSLEALRQPMEDGTVTISRAHGKTAFPARFLLVCAMNPCPCGWMGDGSNRCACTIDRVRGYRAKMSGPLLDRIDVHVVLPPVEVSALQARARGETSHEVRTRVLRAGDVQRERLRKEETGAGTNASLGPYDLERVAALCSEGISACSLQRWEIVLRSRRVPTERCCAIASTIADLDGSKAIRPDHLAEASGLRVHDRGVLAAAA